jgi:hypothetical protein
MARVTFVALVKTGRGSFLTDASALMTGTRSDGMEVLYPVSDLAARYGASVEEETTDPDHAYARFALGRWERPSCWDRLHWT